MDKAQYFCVGCKQLLEFTSVPKTLYCPKTHKIEAVLLDIKVVINKDGYTIVE